MKLSRIFANLLLILLLTSSYFLVKSENSNRRLIRQIELKDSLSKVTTKKDSVFAEKTKEYARVITKYVSGCSFKLGTKSISTPELLKMVNKSFRDVAELTDSLAYLRRSNDFYKKSALELENKSTMEHDSAFIYKALLELINKNYGIMTTYKKDGNTYTYSLRGTRKLDSALVLFPYYKHNLTEDTVNHSWIIVNDTERNIRRQTKKQKEKQD